MDNKQAIKWLKYIKDMYSWNVNCDKSLDIAIKSLKAWDKVIEEIEHLTYFWCEIHPKSVIDDVLHIIDKYKEND